MARGRKKDDGRDRDRDRDRDADRRAAEAAPLLAEAARMLPPEAELAGFQELLESGRTHLAWEALRGQAERFPMGFVFWVQLSKAADLLGGE